jgi:cell division protein FtsW
MKMHTFDRPFLFLTGILVVAGFLIFSSASLGLLARDGATFSSVAFSQLVLGLGMGSIALFVVSRIPYGMWRKYSLYILIAAYILTFFVFIPGIGMESGGARRWVVIFGISFQPSELLKIATVIYFAAWLTSARKKIYTYEYGLIPLCVMLGLIAIPMLLQPDTGTYVVMASALVGMYVVSGCRYRDIVVLMGIALLSLGVLAMARPYILDRITTFLDPTEDPRGSSYQINQSLIAVGSGGWFGRGYGQSIQKFNYLPEPIGDSIFSVAAEEFGFFGAVFIVCLFLALVLRGLFIAAGAPDMFGGLLVTGLAIVLITQVFLNIGSMVGVIPLTGLPLPFISHGGTALMTALIEIGIILNVSRYTKSPSGFTRGVIPIARLFTRT